MAVITFLSDFGARDHYVPAVKAAILSANPSQQIIDISHEVKRHDIGHAGFVLNQVFRAFPAGTIHLVAVDPVLRSSIRLIALELEGHIFVGHDSGVYSLISHKRPDMVVQLPYQPSAFSVRDILVPAVIKLASGAGLNQIGEEISDYQIKMDRQVKATKREIVGQVIHIDHYGNLLTNVSKTDFDKICEINGGKPSYQVRFAREVFNRVHSSYTDVEAGDCFVLFNSSGFLEVGINKGRANDLLGLRLDTPVIIEFNT